MISAQPLKKSITPKQLREARDALGWSPYRLAHVSRVTVSFLHEFETTGRVAPMRWKPRDFDGLAIVRETLEGAGVEFIDENGNGPGVRLSKLSDVAALSRITPNQVRAARDILGWSRQTLSFASGATVHFIGVYEEFGRVGRLYLRRGIFDGLTAIQHAFETAGVEFIDGGGPGVKLRKAEE